MPTCSDCQRDLIRRDFSQGQLRKDPTERRCKECIESTRGSVEAARVSDYYNSDAEDRSTLRFGVGDRVESARPTLRFGVGDRVECNHNCGLWFHGTVIKLWYLNDDAEDDEPMPYQVLLDKGNKIYAPRDEDNIIRSSNVSPPECFVCYDNSMSADNLIVRDCACRGDDGGFVHVDCLTRSAMTKIETVVRSGREQSRKSLSTSLFTSCGTCKQSFEGGSPSSIALAEKCYEMFKYDEVEDPFWHSFSIRNLSGHLAEDKRFDEACALLDKRAAKIYERMETLTRRGSTARVAKAIAELEDELCSILIELAGIDIERNISTGACIVAVLNQAQYLNEKTREYEFSCYCCRKCNILQRFSSLAWENEDLEKALTYAEKALSAFQGDGEHAEQHAENTLSDCLNHCGYLKALVGNRDEGIDMMQRAISIDSRLYGEKYIVTFYRRRELQRILNGEEISTARPRSGW